MDDRLGVFEGRRKAQFVRPKMNRNRLRAPRFLAVLLLAASAPFAMGGCPEFQDEVATAFESATQSILAAAVTLYFDQYRSN